jgi:cell division protein FtsB
MLWRGGSAVLTVGLLVAIVAVAASALVGSDGVNRLLLLRGERQELGEAAVRRLQDNAALRAEIARLRSDPKYLEALARGRLGLVRPDEMVYRFLDPDAP